MEPLFKDITGKPVYAGKPKRVTKNELARAAKAAGEKYFIADCKHHGEGVEFLASGLQCVLCKAEYKKQWYQENREHVLEQKEQWYQENREHILERQKQYHQANREHILGRHKQYHQGNRAYFIALSTCQRMGLPYKGVKQSLPYTEEEFTAHIESLWEDGMSWANYGNGEGHWSVDHIVPVEFFTRTGETDITIINALSNLQPLWHVENVSKGKHVGIEQQRETLHRYDVEDLFK